MPATDMRYRYDRQGVWVRVYRRTVSMLMTLFVEINR